ncbi:TPA: hypothetical protein PRX34_000491 [Escherichia coli]|nr:hypothetical protein [Escherichia coli]
MTIYAKSFIALDGNQLLTGATTAQISPYDRYSCHLCSSALAFHPEWASNCSSLTPLLNPVRTRKSLIWP